MSSPSKMKERPGASQKTVAPLATDEGAAKRPPLSKRLPDMSDKEILSLHANAIRISREEGHPKREAASGVLPLIESELAKRMTTKAEQDAEKRKASSAKRAATRDARKKAAEAIASNTVSSEATSPDDEGHG